MEAKNNPKMDESNRAVCGQRHVSGLVCIRERGEGAMPHSGTNHHDDRMGVDLEWREPSGSVWYRCGAVEWTSGEFENPTPRRMMRELDGPWFFEKLATEPKNNPKVITVHADLELDGPIFVLTARDELSPLLMENWAMWTAQNEGSPSKVEEVLKLAKAMRKWRYQRQGAPTCEYCMEGTEDCKKISTHVVTDEGFIHHYWCGNYKGYLFAEAGVETIEEYFSTDEVSNSYIDDAGDECEACDQL